MSTRVADVKLKFNVSCLGEGISTFVCVCSIAIWNRDLGQDRVQNGQSQGRSKNFISTFVVF